MYPKERESPAANARAILPDAAHPIARSSQLIDVRELDGGYRAKDQALFRLRPGWAGSRGKRSTSSASAAN